MATSGFREFSELLRGNRDFRYLWYAQVISQVGDWFNQIAVMRLLDRLGASGTEQALSLMLRMLPHLVVAPLAGVWIDRVDRRSVLLWADLLRAALVPAFLLTNDRGDVFGIYALIAAQVALTALFEPAKTALIPSLIRPDQLATANALSAATWSVMLAIGAALAGFVINAAGLKPAFLIDSASFLLSALCVVNIARRAPAARPVPESRPRRRWSAGFVDLFEGFRYMFGHRAVLSLVLVKAGIGLSGGTLLLLYVFARDVLPPDHRVDLWTGLLFVARAIGTGVGPFVGRLVGGRDDAAMRRVIAWGFFVAALFFTAFAQAGNFWIGFVLLGFGHLGSSVSWVFSTVLLQGKVEDRFRGRVFSAELSLFTVTFSLAMLATGHALDDWGWNPRSVAVVSGASLLLPGVLWVLAHRSRWTHPTRPEPTALASKAP